MHNQLSNSKFKIVPSDIAPEGNMPDVDGLDPNLGLRTLGMTSGGGIIFSSSMTIILF
jgi:hypothetical protein